MTRPRNLHVLLVFAALMAGPGCAADTNSPPRVSGSTMGTTYTVKVSRLPDGLSSAELKSRIERRLDDINDLMSTWQDDSEISRFNRSRSTGWFPVSQETARVVLAGRQVHELSGGAFDVTVGPLVDLWSFGPDGRSPQIPSNDKIDDVRQRVGFDKLDVRLESDRGGPDEPAALKKTRSDVTVDLSAIAKGYAVDQIARLLDQAGVSDYLVEIGGELRARGEKLDRTPWRVGIEAPVSGRRRLYTSVALNDRAMATSGDYRNFFEVDGKRYSHTIDPRTGWPVDGRLASVTVIAETCMQADALATALMALGEQDGFALATRHDVAALLLVRDGDALVQRATPEFEKLLDGTRRK